MPIVWPSRCARAAKSVTFGQLDARANQVARVLRACGVTRGAHVALLMKNHRRFLEACFGADRAGVYYTTISTRLMADEIAYIVRDCAAQVLVVSAELGELIQQLRPLLPEGLRCFMVGTAVRRVSRAGRPRWTQQRLHRSPTLRKAWTCCIRRAPRGAPRA